MKYKAVIFDLDGTILNTLGDLADAVNFALSKHAYPTHDIEEIRLFIGDGTRRLMEHSMPDDISPEEARECYASFAEYYTQHCNIKTKPFEGIPELLSDLRAAGVKLAVVSNKLDIPTNKICANHFPGLFDEVRGETKAFPRKPKPDLLLDVIHSLGVQLSDVVYVGDSFIDVRTAANAGVDCVAVEWGFVSRDVLIDSGARYLAQTADELRELVS